MLADPFTVSEFLELFQVRLVDLGNPETSIALVKYVVLQFPQFLP